MHCISPRSSTSGIVASGWSWPRTTGACRAPPRRSVSRSSTSGLLDSARISSMKVTREVAFEDAIVESLVADGGYTRGVRTNYDPALALDSAELFTFIGATQNDEWEELIRRNGGDP